MEEVPFDDRQVPRAEIDWERSAWWWRPLTRAIQPAIRMLALIISACAIWLSQGGLALGRWLFNPDWQGFDRSALPEAGPLRSPIIEWVERLFASATGFASFGIREMAFVSFVALWLAAVFGLLGGLLARRALVELGQQTIAPWGESLKLVTGRWISLLWSVGMHLFGITALLIPIVLVGLLCRLGAVGSIVGSVLLLALFPLVFAVGRLALSMFVSFPISTCAIVAEKNADSFEGFSRANAYLFQRPTVTVLCCLILFVIGFVGEQLVYWTLTLGWGAIYGTFDLSAGGTSDVSTSYAEAGTWLTRELIKAFWFSYVCASSAAVYLILRKSVDHTEFDELDAIVHPVEQSLPDIPAAPVSPEGNSTPVESNTPKTSPQETAPNETGDSPPQSSGEGSNSDDKEGADEQAG